jgi:hypothetical protein
MGDDALDAQLEHLHALTGTWTTEGAHALLPGEEIRGQATFEWLDGGKFLIWRSHYEHPQLPDAVSVTGVTDDRLSMHYFDTRGVFRVYSVSADPGIWRFWRDAHAPDLSQRYTGTFSADGDTITSRGELSRDGTTWDDDLQLSYRRTR